MLTFFVVIIDHSCSCSCYCYHVLYVVRCHSYIIINDEIVFPVAGVGVGVIFDLSILSVLPGFIVIYY